ncbi:WD40 repeat domain-containing protein [Nonomuraea spiralis]|uniref:WD40 repeat domain-containing protein n=1 Tax=Nonomuraea spiralis TaxID=46182 RepID=UPI0037AC0787
MRSRTEAVLAGLVVLVLAGGCADPAAERVSLVNDSGGPPSSSLAPGMPRVATGSPTPVPSRPAPSATAPLMPVVVPVTSLAEPMATGTPLPASGSPRFFVTVGAPYVAPGPFPPGQSPSASGAPAQLPPVVNDAATGAFVAPVPRPKGGPSGWELVAAAPDNRTFALAGGILGKSFRFFLVRLEENGQPGEPRLVPEAEPEPEQVVALALSHDGTRLAYACDLAEGGTKVTVLDVATGRRRDWTTFGKLVDVAWAPDGRSLATVGNGWGIGLLDLAAGGTDLRKASRLLRSYTEVPLPRSIAFTPDGRALLYTAGSNVNRLSVDGGEPERVAQAAVPAGARADLRLSVDGSGRHLLYTHDWRAYRVDLADGSATSAPIDIGSTQPRDGRSAVVAW